MMRNITTPQAILCGLGLIALAIAFSSYVPNSVIREAKADAGWLANINRTLQGGNQNIVQALNGIKNEVSKCK
jgi:hypothetical protein